MRQIGKQSSEKKRLLTTTSPTAIAPATSSAVITGKFVSNLTSDQVAAYQVNFVHLTIGIHWLEKVFWTRFHEHSEVLQHAKPRLFKIVLAFDNRFLLLFNFHRRFRAFLLHHKIWLQKMRRPKENERSNKILQKHNNRFTR